MCAHQVGSYGPPVTAEQQRPPTDGNPAAGHGRPRRYEIRVEGHLGSRWATWFDGLDLTTEDDGVTVLRGPVTDQAALHGHLQKLRDIGIPLISLTALAESHHGGPAAPGERT